MAYVYSAPQTTGLFGKFLATAERFNTQRKEKHAYSVTRRELMNLSDATLRDLGISRSTINQAALEATIGCAH